MLSPDTWRADVGAKRRTYQMLGVQECWLFDPSVKYLEAPLIGYRLHDGRCGGRCGGRYRRVEADASGCFPSKALGLELHVRAGRLRFRDPATGKDLTTYAEAEERAETAEETGQNGRGTGRNGRGTNRSDGKRTRGTASAAGGTRCAGQAIGFLMETTCDFVAFLASAVKVATSAS